MRHPVLQTEIQIDFKTNWNFFSSSNRIFTACVAYKNQDRTEMEFSYSQTENFEVEKFSVNFFTSHLIPCDSPIPQSFYVVGIRAHCKCFLHKNYKDSLWMGFLWKKNISVLSDFLSREKLTHKKTDEFLNDKIYKRKQLVFWSIVLSRIEVLCVSFSFERKSEKIEISFLQNHGLRTPNEGINQSYLKNWADVADKICFGRT